MLKMFDRTVEKGREFWSNSIDTLLVIAAQFKGWISGFYAENTREIAIIAIITLSFIVIMISGFIADYSILLYAVLVGVGIFLAVIAGILLKQ